MSKQRFAEIKKLQQKKFREETGTFIIEGWKSIEEAINAGVGIETILYDESELPNKLLPGKFQESVKEVLSVKAKEIESLSDTVTSQGIIAVAKKPDSNVALNAVLKKSEALLVALDSINDPGNLGTIIRTCDWFGVDALVVGRNSVEIYNPKVVRATMGSLFHLPIVGEIELMDFCTQSRRENFKIYSSELSDSEDVRNITLDKKTIIIIGSESHGVSKEISKIADKKISIPRFGLAESLNAAMACGIILSQIKLK